ncbi:hypothetical protein CR513_15692, partial [Mucuna pruriens]
MTHSEVRSLAEDGKWVCGSHADMLKVVRYGERERVCHAAKEGEEPFIYMYETMLLDLGVILPSDFFEADVLRGLGIAPSQLHPNGWAAIQDFKVVCLALGMLPSAPVFLNHYTTRVGESASRPVSGLGLFTSYTASYKGFKSRFVKIQAAEKSHFCIDSRPLPLYWQEPPKFKGLARSQLPLEAKVDLQLLDNLPRGMSCRDIVSWMSSNNATLKLKSMLKRQGVDMAELIKKARLTNDARSSGQKASSTKTTSTVAEKKSAASLAEKDSAKRCPTRRRPSGRPTLSRLRRRLLRRGRLLFLLLHLCLRNLKGKVVVTAGPGLPLGGLPCYVAPPSVGSMWGPGFDMRSLLPISRIPPHDRGLLVSAGAAGSIDMMTAYMACSLATLETWRGMLCKAEQIVAKEAITKELEKAQKAKAESLAEVQKMKEASQKANAEIEDLKAKLAAAQTESTLLKTKVSSSEAEMVLLKSALAESQSRVVEVESILASDKEALKAAEAKTASAESEASKLKEENAELAERVACLEGAIVDQHEDGFNKALRQIALLALDFDLSPYDMTKEKAGGIFCINQVWDDGSLDFTLKEEMEITLRDTMASRLDAWVEWFNGVNTEGDGTNIKGHNGF